GEEPRKRLGERGLGGREGAQAVLVPGDDARPRPGAHLGQPDPAETRLLEENDLAPELEGALPLEEAERPRERDREGAPPLGRGVEPPAERDPAAELVARLGPAREEGREDLAAEPREPDPSRDHDGILALGADSPSPSREGRSLWGGSSGKRTQS